MEFESARKTANRKAEIIKAIEARGPLGYNDLKHLICEEQKVISARPFREILKELVKSGIVKKTPVVKSQKVLYSIGNKDQVARLIVSERLSSYATLFESRFEAIKRIYQKMTSVEQGHLVSEFLLMFQLARTEADMALRYYPSNQIRQEAARISRIYAAIMKLVGLQTHEIQQALPTLISLYETYMALFESHFEEQLKLYNICYLKK